MRSLTPRAFRPLGEGERERKGREKERELIQKSKRDNIENERTVLEL